MSGELDATFEATDLLALVPVPVGVPIGEAAYRPRVNLDGRHRYPITPGTNFGSRQEPAPKAGCPVDS